jgi:Cu(I)/Ag(I) efflux system periplasmic protein CusF
MAGFPSFDAVSSPSPERREARRAGGNLAGQTGLKLAPEAYSQKVGDFLDKNMRLDNCLAAAIRAMPSPARFSHSRARSRRMEFKKRAWGRRAFLGLSLVCVAASGWSALALADKRRPAAAAKIFHGVGAITGLDAASGEVGIDHEAIPGLMSAMEMEYQARPAKILEGLKRGDKVEFELDGKTLTILAIKQGELFRASERIGEAFGRLSPAFARYKILVSRAGPGKNTLTLRQ